MRVRVSRMPVNYSSDLRWRAVWLVTLRGMTYEEVSQMLFISERSIRRYVSLFLTTGNVEATKQRHGPQCLLSDFEQIIVLQALIDHPSMYLVELQKSCLMLLALGFTYQLYVVLFIVLDLQGKSFNTLHMVAVRS